MNKPRIKIKPLSNGLWALQPKTSHYLSVVVPASALRDLPAYADMLERICAPLVLRNLRDCITVK